MSSHTSPALAGTPAGTEIRNTAVGAFEDLDDLGNVIEVFSNEVVVVVAEVAGIGVFNGPTAVEEAPSTIADAGPNQDNGEINSEDIVYFTFRMTNLGNDATQFFIPDAPSSITGGTSAGDIQIVAYDSDGTETSAVDLTSNNITVPANGATTGDLLNGVNGTNNGSVFSNGTITLRVPIKVNSNLSDGETVTVVMGDTPVPPNANSQNQPYEAGNQDIYTQDNPDGAENEATGAPANGDAAGNRQEASSSQSVNITAPQEASISGAVWEDTNFDGVQDPAEPEMDGITLNLVDENGFVQDTVVTAGGGLYTFSNVVPADYTVEVEPLKNFVISPQAQGSDVTKDSDVNRVSRRTDVITVSAGETIEAIGVGFSPDSDGDTIPDEIDGTGDRDGDTIPDNLDVDPAGYFYDETDGKVIPGGFITVSGPGNIDITDDGSSAGFYQWFTDGTAGVYTMTVNPPSGYEISTNCSPATSPPSPFDPTGLTPDPYALGESKDGETGALFSADCADNPYYLSFDLASGDPFVINNNISLTPISTASGSSISGKLFEDNGATGAGNNLPDTDESVIDQVSVRLYQDNGDGIFNEATDTVVDGPFDTDSNGDYIFSGLNNGTYFVVVDQNDPDLPTGFFSESYVRSVTVAGSDIVGENFPFDEATSGNNNPTDIVANDTPSDGIPFGDSTNRCNNFLVRSFDVNSSFPVGGLSLGLNISHPYRGAIRGFLQAPSGNFVRFLDINGGDTNDNYDVLFQDGGGAINDGNADNVSAPLYDRTVAPNAALSALVGEPAAGRWRLYLCDGGSGQTGTYNSSQLTITAPDISGYAYDDVNDTKIREGSESTLANIGFTAYRDDGDGIFEPGGDDVAVATGQTGTAGSYAITGLANGSYWVDIDETDADLAGRTYNGSAATNTADPRLVNFSGSAITDVDFPFTQDLAALCEPGDPEGELSFLDNPTLESGSSLQVGAIYRFPDIFANVDGLVEIVSFNNGASLASIDNNASGVAAAFQPTLNGTSGTTSSVDFVITFVEKGTTTPVPITFKASGVDIDGDGGTLREFIELTNLTSFTVGSSIDAFAITDGTRFESNTTAVQPGVSATAAQSVATAQYDNISQLRYRIGGIDEGNSNAIRRLNSLYFGCTNGPAASKPELLLVKRITAVNGDRSANPNDATPLNVVDLDDGATSDENSGWPNNYLIGAPDAGAIKPGDELEYSIYFLSSGDVAISDVNICDLIPAGTTYVGSSGELALGTDPAAPWDDTRNADVGEYIAVDTTTTDADVPGIGLCRTDRDTTQDFIATENLNGSVWIELDNALTPIPAGQAGYIRFRVVVD